MNLSQNLSLEIRNNKTEHEQRQKIREMWRYSRKKGRTDEIYNMQTSVSSSLLYTAAQGGISESGDDDSNLSEAQAEEALAFCRPSAPSGIRSYDCPRLRLHSEEGGRTRKKTSVWVTEEEWPPAVHPCAWPGSAGWGWRSPHQAQWAPWWEEEALHTSDHPVWSPVGGRVREEKSKRRWENERAEVGTALSLSLRGGRMEQLLVWVRGGRMEHLALTKQQQTN